MAKSLRNWLSCFLFALPALGFYTVFVIVSIFGTVKLSFFKWDGASPTKLFVGLGNYIRIFSDQLFYKALVNNSIWILFTICVPVMIGLILALIVTQSFIKLRTFFRTMFFMPSVVSLVAVGVVWGWIYLPQYGALAKVLAFFRVPEAISLDFLGDPARVIWYLVIAGSWTCFGFNMVIFIAAISNIDPSHLEVAYLEGANPAQRFFYVILPLIRNTTTLLILNSLIGSFKVFDLIYIMTKGGPFHSSEVVATYMYDQSFRLNDYGYGSALSIVLAVIISICTVSYLRMAEREKV